MSLLTQMAEDCRILTKTRSDDDYGGSDNTWTPGKVFKAAIAKIASPEQRIAEKQGISEAFTVVVEEGMMLNYHDVFERVSDGAIFRVNSRTKDSTAHPASTVRIAAVNAERWELPT